MVNASIMQAMALDDSEFGVLFDKDEGNKENQPLSSSSRRVGPLGEKPLQQAGGGNGGGKQGREGAGEATVSTEPGQWFGSFPDPHNAEGGSGPEEVGQGHVNKVSNCRVGQSKTTN